MNPSQLTNVLSRSASPYLQQHKDNPVHWQIWGEAALNEAKRSGKPILLSIGYAACHWCHVMAHESFEDPETAAVMNELYVNIKVDREERSDIDQIYMAALHAMGEQGGWPLTIFLNPEGEPFWGGTYFPKTASHGRPDFVTVLKSLSKIYHDEPDKIVRNTQSIRAHLAQTLADAGIAAEPEEDVLGRHATGILSIVDRKNGGIGHAPKFPSASMLEVLWRHWRNTGSQRSGDTAMQWITALITGGIYDHLGGGLARYCVDAIWLVPHFEKMLYDNAQLVRALVWAHGETNHPLFRTRIEETVGWLEAEMLMPGGGFASSLDADSEGEEGRFYVWDKAEIDAALGDDADIFCRHYDVSEGGNWEGRNILNRLRAPQADDETEVRLAAARRKLLALRSGRERPRPRWQDPCRLERSYDPGTGRGRRQSRARRLDRHGARGLRLCHRIDDDGRPPGPCLVRRRHHLSGARLGLRRDDQCRGGALRSNAERNLPRYGNAVDGCARRTLCRREGRLLLHRGRQQRCPAANPARA